MNNSSNLGTCVKKEFRFLMRFFWETNVTFHHLQHLLTWNTNLLFLQYFVTGNENLVLHINRNWTQPPLPQKKRKKERKINSSYQKRRSECQCQNQETIHWSPCYVSGGIWKVEYGRTFSEDVYCKKPDQVHEPICQKYLVLVNRKYVIPQAWNWKAFSVKQRDTSISFISPDIAHRDFYLFRSLEHFISGRLFRKKRNRLSIL